MKRQFTYFVCYFILLLLANHNLQAHYATQLTRNSDPEQPTLKVATMHPRKFVFKTNNPTSATDISNAFTTEDAANLRKFFQFNSQPIECDAQHLKVIAYKNLTNNDNPAFQQSLDITQQLANQGYVVTQLECSDYKVVFNLQKNKDGKIAMKPTALQHVATNQTEPCNACGNIKISEQAAKKILETLNPNDQKSLDLGFDE